MPPGRRYHRQDGTADAPVLSDDTTLMPNITSHYGQPEVHGTWLLILNSADVFDEGILHFRRFAVSRQHGE